MWDRRALREDNPKPVGVLAGSDDRSLFWMRMRLSDILTSAHLKNHFSGHVDGIAFLDPKGDGRHLISNSKDQTIKLWDIRSVYF